MSLASAPYGVVLFDKPSSYSPEKENPGYLCIAGDEPVRIFGTGDLPSDVRWLTDINLDVAFASRLRNSPKLLNTNFLRVSVKTILSELGLNTRTLDTQAFVLSKLFDNVMKQADHLLGIQQAPAYSLNQAIPAQIGHYQPMVSTEVRNFSVQSHQSYSQCEVKPADNSIFTSLVIPRVSHCQSLLDAGLPWGGWQRVSFSGIRPSQTKIDFLLSQDLPAIAQVSISKVSRKYNAILNYGAGAGMLNSRSRSGNNIAIFNGRHCATTNELAFLSQVADVQVEDAYICDSLLESRYQLPVSTPLSRLSYSYGLLSESYWTSLSRDVDGKVQRTPLTSWLHSQDRLTCIKFAVALNDLGYKILGYGYGRINIALEQHQLDNYHKHCLELGLVPALGVAISDVVSLPDKHTAEDLQIGLSAQGAFDDLLDLDNKFTQVCVNSDR